MRGLIDGSGSAGHEPLVRGQSAVMLARAEAMASYNLAVLFARMARTSDAVEIQHRAVALAEATEHPDLQAMRSFLIRLQEQGG